MTNLQNAVWPGWETVRVIGRGSFGTVYEIQRDVFGHTEKAALKVISIPQSEKDIDDLINDGYDEKSITARFKGYLQDIIREYTMMAEMKGCANIVYCDDVKYIQHDNGFGWDIYIKMELLEALPKAIGKTVSDKQAVEIATDICSALAFCEKHKLLHRDIKPQNIFVAPDGTCKLGDFGIAKTAERTTSGTKTGTYKYMAPEVYNNQPYGAKADIYSLGLVLYWLLNERRTPFLPLPPVTPTSTEEDKARARRFAGETIMPPAHGCDKLKKIVLKACAYDPEDRYQSAEEMLQDLENVFIDKYVTNNTADVNAFDEDAGEKTVKSSPDSFAAAEAGTVGLGFDKGNGARYTVDTYDADGTVGKNDFAGQNSAQISKDQSLKGKVQNKNAQSSEKDAVSSRSGAAEILLPRRDMPESKKALRILAGIFLLIELVLSLASLVSSYLRIQSSSEFFQIYWPILLSYLFTVLVAVFIFARGFKGAGIVEALLVLWNLYRLGSSLVNLAMGRLSDLPAGYFALSSAMSLMNLAAVALLAVGFFLHRPASKALFILGGILGFLSAMLSYSSSFIIYNTYSAPNLARILGTLLPGVFLDGFSLLAWIFMGSYFGAQRPQEAVYQAPAYETQQ